MHACGTPLSWIKSALSPSYQHVASVRSLDNIMGAEGMMPGVGYFFLIDVILNRELVCSDMEAPPCNSDELSSPRQNLMWLIWGLTVIFCTAPS